MESAAPLPPAPAHDDLHDVALRLGHARPRQHGRDRDDPQARRRGHEPARRQGHPSCHPATPRQTAPAAKRASPPQCGSSMAEAASCTGSGAGLELRDGQPPDVRRQDVRQSRARLDHAEDADELPARPGLRPAAAPVTVKIIPTRLRNDSAKTSASPRNGRPDETSARSRLFFEAGMLRRSCPDSARLMFACRRFMGTVAVSVPAPDASTRPQSRGTAPSAGPEQGWERPP